MVKQLFPFLEKNNTLISIVIFVLGLVIWWWGGFYLWSNHIEIADNSKKNQTSNWNYSPNILWDGNIFNYSDIKDPNYINKRPNYLIWLLPKDLVWNFFDLQNKWWTWYRDV